MLLICFEQDGLEMPLHVLAATRGFGQLSLTYLRELVKHLGFDGGLNLALVPPSFRVCAINPPFRIVAMRGVPVIAIGNGLGFG